MEKHKILNEKKEGLNIALIPNPHYLINNLKKFNN